MHKDDVDGEIAVVGIRLIVSAKLLQGAHQAELVADHASSGSVRCIFTLAREG